MLLIFWVYVPWRQHPQFVYIRKEISSLIVRIWVYPRPFIILSKNLHMQKFNIYEFHMQETCTDSLILWNSMAYIKIHFYPKLYFFLICIFDKEFLKNNYVCNYIIITVYGGQHCLRIACRLRNQQTDWPREIMICILVYIKMTSSIIKVKIEGRFLFFKNTQEN